MDKPIYKVTDSVYLKTGGLQMMVLEAKDTTKAEADQYLICEWMSNQGIMQRWGFYDFQIKPFKSNG